MHILFFNKITISITVFHSYLRKGVLEKINQTELDIYNVEDGELVSDDYDPSAE